jgi:DNA polymerase-3 subunit alpha
VVKYINEARGMGITVLPPDVNESDLYFTPVGEAVRFGLAAIKNVGENTARAILEARAKQGRLESLVDFCETVDPKVLNKRAFESLIKSGAMDSFGAREQLLASVEDALFAVQRAARGRNSSQHGLFGAAAAAAAPAPAPFELREAEPWSEQERLSSEYAMLGYYVSGHPLAKYANRLQELRAVELATVEGRRNKEEVTVAGLIVATRPMRSKRGARWAIYTIQDMTGMQELLAFPESFERLDPVMKNGVPLLIKSRVNVEEVGTRLVLMEARPLEEVGERPAALMRVRVDLGMMDEFTLDRLQELFASRPGACPVAFDLVLPDGSIATLEAQQRVRADQELVAAVGEMCGPGAVEVIR